VSKILVAFATKNGSTEEVARATTAEPQQTARDGSAGNGSTIIANTNLE
jgi:menaquinone-dependent protoporphyrinogen IX oxidase